MRLLQPTTESPRRLIREFDGICERNCYAEVDDRSEHYYEVILLTSKEYMVDFE
jgi:hypothetical protein